MSNREPRDVVWAIFLLFVGVIFLFNTTGMVGWGVWIYILRFWPILLILGGVKLIIGKSLVAEIIISVLALIFFVFVGAISYLSFTQKSVSFLPEGVNRCVSGSCFGIKRGTETKGLAIYDSEEFEGVDSRKLKLNVGASAFTLVDEDSDEFLKADAVYPAGYSEPEWSKQVKGTSLLIDYRTASFTGFNVFYNERSEYDFVFGKKDVLTDLDLILGAGDGSIDLDEVLLNEIDATVGAGRLALKLGERSIPTEQIILEIGAGEVVLELPESIGYTLDYDLGVGTIESNGEEIATFAGSNKAYESANYDSAEIKVSIVANVGVGSLVINSY